MATVVYTPAFQHEEWVDNVDRVTAGGANGFNVRFNSIEAEFQNISQAVQIIDGVLSSLGQVVSAPVTIGMTPILLPFGASPQWSDIFWSRTSGGVPLGTFVEKPTPIDQAWGVMPLSLPDGVRLSQIKVLGEQTGAGDVTTDLYQEARTPPYTRAALVTVTGMGVGATAPTPIPGTPVFNTAANLYYLLTRVQNAPGSTVRLRGFQLTYQP
jgi:hypothetical protein